MANDIIERLKAQLPELEHGQETHRQWRDCDQKFRDQNPHIGSVEHHDKMVRVYQDRIDVINAAIAELAAERGRREEAEAEAERLRVGIRNARNRLASIVGSDNIDALTDQEASRLDDLLNNGGDHE